MLCMWSKPQSVAMFVSEGRVASEAMPALLHEVMVSSGPGLLLRVLSGSLDLEHPGFELMSMASVTTKDPADALGLVSHLRPCWYPRAMQRSEPFLSG